MIDEGLRSELDGPGLPPPLDLAAESQALAGAQDDLLGQLLQLLGHPREDGLGHLGAIGVPVELVVSGFLDPVEGLSRLLDHLVEHAPEEYRESMLRNVRLNREITEAWAEHGVAEA